jgi:hypothetical protein
LNVGLHNVAEVREMEDGGVRFQRVPEDVRLALNAHAQERMLDVAGSEIRFVLEGGRAEVKLHAAGGVSCAQVFYGDFHSGRVETVGPDPTTLRVEPPPWFMGLDPALLGPLSFSPRLCRVVLSRGAICFHGVDGDVRPPGPGEVPSLRYLAYGTSITQGSATTLRHLCYVAGTAWRLGADAINLGVGSSAFCEEALADYIAARGDWNVATLALSTNMSGFDLGEFERRVAYMVDRVGGSDPERPVACITIWPKAADLGPEHVSPGHRGTPEQYREALRGIVRSCGRPNVHLLEGPALLPEMRGLAPDLLHPTDYGHALIAENLARELSRIVRVGRGPAGVEPPPASPPAPRGA